MKRIAVCLSLLLSVALNAWCAEPSRTDAIREKLLSGDRDYVFVAMHRGDWRNYPENSRGAIESCIALGADIVELDVHRTKDGRFVLNHDDKIDRTTTGKGLIRELTFEEIRRHKLRAGQGGKDAPATEYGVLSLEEALAITRGKILMNIDKFTKHPREILDVVAKCGAVKDVLVKSSLGYEESRRLFGEEYWKMVESGELLYMPVITFRAKGKRKTDDSRRFEEWLSHEPRKGSMYEMCFDTDAGEAKLKRFEGVPGNPRIWVNTLWDSLDNRRPDKLALKDPDAVWGWCVANRVTMIQTEYGKEALAYLKAKGRRDLAK